MRSITRDLELRGMPRDFFLQPDFLGDVALDAEVSDDPALRVVQADVVPLDVDRLAFDVAARAS